MNAVVLDTDVVSFAFKGDGRFRPYESEVAGKMLVVSFMTVAELRLLGHVRNWGKPRIEKLLGFLTANFAVYPSTDELCEIWAES
jgi:hypothetical protein